MEKSPIYRREGMNIHSDVFISIAQAILGGTAKAQGVLGPISVEVRNTLLTRTLTSGLANIR